MNGRYGSTLRRAVQRPGRGKPACANTRLHGVWCMCSWRAMVPIRQCLGVVEAQDLRLDVRGDGHGEVLFGCSTGLGSVAESRGEQAADSDGRSDGTAIAAGWLYASTIVPSSPPPDPRVADHPIDPVGNPAASRYLHERGDGVIAPHD